MVTLPRGKRISFLGVKVGTVEGFTFFPGCLTLRTEGLPDLFKFLTDLKWLLPLDPTNEIIGYFAIDPSPDFDLLGPLLCRRICGLGSEVSLQRARHLFTAISSFFNGDVLIPCVLQIV